MLLEIGATRTWISVDRLKPHTGAAAPAPSRLHLDVRVTARVCSENRLNFGKEISESQL